MANHKSAKKRIRQNQKRNLRNRSVKSALKTELKKFMMLIEENKTAEAREGLPKIQKAIDRAHTKNILTKNAASRKKSSITLKVNSLALAS